MAFDNEKILLTLNTYLKEEKADDLVDAAVLFCEEHDMDMEDFIAGIDNVIRDKIFMDAVNKNHVRKKNIPKFGRLPV